MQLAPDDTTADVAERQWAALAAMSPLDRLRLTSSLSVDVLTLCRIGVARALPDADGTARQVEFVRRCHGEHLATELDAWFRRDV